MLILLLASLLPALQFRTLVLKIQCSTPSVIPKSGMNNEMGVGGRKKKLDRGE